MFLKYFRTTFKKIPEKNFPEQFFIAKIFPEFFWN